MQNDIIKNKDIIMVGLVDYEFGLGNNCKNIAEEFSKENRVLFINPPLDRSTLLKNKNNRQLTHILKVLSGEAPALEKVASNLWVYTPKTVLESINWIGIPFLHTFFNKRNNRKYAREIKKAIQEVGFKNFLLFNDNDIFRSFYLKEYIQPEKYIYYIRDNLTSMNYWKKHGIRLEKKLIKKADVVIANSTYLSAYAKDYNPSATYVGQGCDFSLFDGRMVIQEPGDLKQIGHPRIGYVGNLTHLRLDLELIEYIAKNNSNWQIILVGPEDKVFKESALHSYDNIVFTGSKKMEELSSYIAYFDVCINPQAINHLTIGNYPRKIDEYLAMGKPVVATKTIAMDSFAEYVYLCKDHAEYVSNIRKALQENNSQRVDDRKKFALNHSWENNVKEIYKAINKVESH